MVMVSFHHHLQQQQQQQRPLMQATTGGPARFMFTSRKQPMYYPRRLYLLLFLSLFVVAHLMWMGQWNRRVSSENSNTNSWLSDDSYDDNNPSQDASASLCRFGLSGLRALTTEHRQGSLAATLGTDDAEKMKWVPSANSSLVDRDPTSRIPNTLIFVPKVGNGEELFHTKRPRLLYENVENTIQKYKELFYKEYEKNHGNSVGVPKDSTHVLTLTESECRHLIYQANPDLVEYFDEIPGVVGRFTSGKDDGLTFATSQRRRRLQETSTATGKQKRKKVLSAKKMIQGM